jgi:hypothetical protein
MVRYLNKTDILSLKKLYDFDCKVRFKVLMKSGTNLGHFGWTLVNEMKPCGILCLKGPTFSLNPTHFE